MNFEITIKQSPANKPIENSVVLPYGSFQLKLQIPIVFVPPYTVKITEKRNDSIEVGNLNLSGCDVLLLDKPTDIFFPNTWMGGGYKVQSLSNFVMKYNTIWFIVYMKNKFKEVKDFKGSKMIVEITKGNDSHKREISILNSDPNNHYHRDSEEDYVDGWYFKCLHVDEGIATPFFFLYGINKSVNQQDSKCFAMFGKGGSVNWGTNGPTSQDHGLLTPPEKYYIQLLDLQFDAEKLFGLNLSIYENYNKKFYATDQTCKGRYKIENGVDKDKIISWDLVFTKIHCGFESDYNPLEKIFSIFVLAKILNPALPIFNPVKFEKYEGMPLMIYQKNAFGVHAYAMNHNMNSFVSGIINWKGTQYVLDNNKGYQDENWGSAGFPHPYVWMQANNFYGNSFVDTSLIAVFTPAMPGLIPNKKNTLGCIYFIHQGKQYEFLDIGEPLAAPLDLLPSVDFSTITCKLKFDYVQTEVDMNDNVEDIIGKFTTRSLNIKPKQWVIESTSEEQDYIKITVTCDVSTVLLLEAPSEGKMQENVTKETLNGNFKVEFTPKGNQNQTITLFGYGTAEYGD